jgi:F0F1-type ATP synthase membrane subunit a
MAGHVLLTIFFLFTAEFLPKLTAPLGLVTLLIACALILFELLVISIQAYIFTMLTAFYIAESVHGHADDEGEPAPHGAPQARHELEGIGQAA